MYERDLIKTVKTVKENHSNISVLKEKAILSDNAVKEVKTTQETYEHRLKQVEFYINKLYYLACENRQRNSKGNFILSGRHLPRFRVGEDLT